MSSPTSSPTNGSNNPTGSMHTVRLAKAIESTIRNFLTQERKNHPGSYRISIFDLYSVFESWHTLGVVTSHFFNQVVDDMKRAGIIVVVKGGVFLSDPAWEHYKNQQAQATQAQEGGQGEVSQ